MSISCVSYTEKQLPIALGYLQVHLPICEAVYMLDKQFLQVLEAGTNEVCCKCVVYFEEREEEKAYVLAKIYKSKKVSAVIAHKFTNV